MKPGMYVCFVYALLLGSCVSSNDSSMKVSIYETSAAGNKLDSVALGTGEGNADAVLNILPEEKFRSITGFGGSFTESSAYLLNKLGKDNRNKILNAYFGDEGARYSFTRTHINSCDFSLSNYSYAAVENDTLLEHFNIDHDRDDIIPMIREALAISSDGFKIIASPWTAPPWMKDNNDWVGGKLLPKYYDTWALFFSKYLDAYKAEGIDIWGLTVENEPLGNGNNWESMHFSPEEMSLFVENHLGPQLEADGKSEVKILGYDQNREHLREWVDAMYANPKRTKSCLF